VAALAAPSVDGATYQGQRTRQALDSSRGRALDARFGFSELLTSALAAARSSLFMPLGTAELLEYGAG